MSQSPFTPTDQLSITDENALDHQIRGPDGELLVFTREELEGMTNKQLRRLAAYADTDQINGRSVQLEVISFYRTQRSLAEYAED